MIRPVYTVPATAIVYTFLFYKQSAGLNFLLFTVFLLAVLALSNRTLIRNIYWLLCAAASLFTSFFVFIYGSYFAVFANITSLAILSAVSVNQVTSLPFQLQQAIYSAGAATGLSIKRMFSKGQNPDTPDRSIRKRLIVYLSAISIALIFFFIYRQANPLFEKFTGELNWSLVDWAMLLFLSGGILLMNAFFNHTRISNLDSWENNLGSIAGNREHRNAFSEKQILLIALLLLNGMMIFITALDIKFLYLDGQLPPGVTHKQFVHNGVGMLMLSIVLGVTMLLFFYRGALHYDKSTRLIRLLSASWLLLNVMMVFSTGIRNFLYVHDGLLTYKRLGVFMWLFLCAAGLIVTAIKLFRAKNIWFVIKSNVNIAWIMIIICSAADWDKLISEFNISNVKQLSILDKKYLISLSEGNIPSLYAIRDSSDFQTDSIYHYRENSGDNTQLLDIKIYNVMNESSQSDFRSFSLRKNTISEELPSLLNRKTNLWMDLNYANVNSLFPLFKIRHLTALQLRNTGFKDLKQLALFPAIRSLNIARNYIDSLESLPHLPHLRSLDLNGNFLKHLSGLEKIINLQFLDLSNNSLKDLYTLPVLPKLDTIVLGGNEIFDYSALGKLPSLHALFLSDIRHPINELPLMRKLRTLSVQNCQGTIKLLIKLPKHDSLEELIIESALIHQLYGLTFKPENQKGDQPKFPVLKSIRAEHCGLTSLHPLRLYRELNRLYLANNNIVHVTELSGLKNLRILQLANNRLADIEPLRALSGLTFLDLSGNVELADCSPVSSLTELETLGLASTNFSDLKLLKPLKQLRWLYIENSRVRSLQGIDSLQSLEFLSLTTINENDFQWIEKLPNLKEIRVSSFPDAKHSQKITELRKKGIKIQQE